MDFFNNFFNMFRGKNGRGNDTESNNDLVNMKDTHVSLGEDPGSLENQDNEKDQ
tara:strand:- start:196 stop:357 length:162 start_codon:yes stop_codon:yes gene_type:complete